MTDPKHIVVAGAGAWGTALASLAATNGFRVSLWARDAAHAAEIEQSRENARRLPGFPLPNGIEPTSDLADVADAGLLLLAIPSSALNNVVVAFARRVSPLTPVVIACKGFEADTGKLLSDTAASVMPATSVMVLSGPSFAEDVIRGLPTAVTLAGTDRAAAQRARDVFAATSFRIYLSDDLVGTQLGGAAKNVLAIAAGIVEGRGLGASAKAALIARGFAELGKLVEARGGRRETVAGLSGLGDLVLTCASPMSRNFSYGLALGHGQSPEAALSTARGVVEGASTAPLLVREADRLEIDLPICRAVASVLAGRLSVDGAIESLLARPLRDEL